MYKVLVIDDEKVVCELIKVKLERSGFMVYLAHDGVEGIEVVEKTRPDLIILDVLMPRMDGFQFYKKIRERVGTADIPVLVMTARGAMKDSFEGMGVAAFLSKPFEPEDLVSEVQKLLSSPSKKIQSRKRALLAGVDPRKLDVMQRQLQTKGYTVEIATDGYQALGKALKFLPDLFILQIDMPDIDAEDIIGIINNYPGGQDISVLLYSLLQTKDEIIRSPWGRYLDDGHRKEARDRERPLKIIDKFDSDSFLERIKEFIA
ncbi:MAG TPA: response regulator [Candidatus Omnitrophota bacterium]|nr:response regulator [Candidatus Omnitrophota bacterium]HPD84190.1 response regulator [Candidatus Omnitrophota bacterium]HRZ03046.1 response regulator [Candidatus Omnitrophota bacterium]